MSGSASPFVNGMKDCPRQPTSNRSAPPTAWRRWTILWSIPTTGKSTKKTYITPEELAEIEKMLGVINV